MGIYTQSAGHGGFHTKGMDTGDAVKLNYSAASLPAAFRTGAFRVGTVVNPPAGKTITPTEVFVQWTDDSSIESVPVRHLTK
jgi:hypothetical protein